MTVSELSAAKPSSGGLSALWPRVAAYWARPWVRRLALALLGIVLVWMAIATRLYRLRQYPFVVTDEGTYTYQAWSFATEWLLSPIGYLFDHPPGWVHISWWLDATDALARNHGLSAVAGREYMVLMAAATVLLLLFVAWRLQYRLVFLALACLLWTLSPVAMTFSRQVFLDNIVMPWLLLAALLLLRPKFGLWSVFGSALVFVVACLAKEAAFLASVGLLYLVWQAFEDCERRRRFKALAVFMVTAFAGLLSYPAFALFTGRIDQWWGMQVQWQLHDRLTSGFVFDSSSEAYNLVTGQWLALDHWLPVAAILAVLPALFIKRLRGLALIQSMYVLVLLWPTRYLPVPFIIELLPFGCLLIAGLFDTSWPSLQSLCGTVRQRQLSYVGIAAVTVPLLAFTTLGGATSWQNTYDYAYSTDDTQYQRQAIAWMQTNLSPDDVAVVDTELWLDGVQAGLPVSHVLLPGILDNGPELLQQAGGLGVIDYLVLGNYTMHQTVDSATYPTVYQLIAGADVVQRFGDPDNPDDYRAVTVLKLRQSTG